VLAGEDHLVSGVTVRQDEARAAEAPAQIFARERFSCTLRLRLVVRCSHSNTLTLICAQYRPHCAGPQSFSNADAPPCPQRTLFVRLPPDSTRDVVEARSVLSKALSVRFCFIDGSIDHCFGLKKCSSNVFDSEG
jgi:hypothetical protein